MSRHLRLLGFAVWRLRRHPGRTLLLVAVYSLVVALVASLLLYVAALKGEARRLLAGAPELVVQRLGGGRHRPIPVEWADAVAALRGVGRVRPRLWGYTYDPPTGATLTLWAADSVPAEALAEGEGTLDPAGGTCFIGRGLAEARWLVVGQRLPLRAADGEVFAPRVVGVFTAGSALLTNDLVVLGEADLRRFFDLPPGLATDLAVEVHNPREVATVARKVREAWPDARTLGRDELLRTYDAVFDWRGGIWAALLLSSVAAFALLVMDCGTGLSAEDRRSLGLLKALGWSPREVMELHLLEGLVVSAVALLTGVLLAQVHLVVLDGALFVRVLRGWSVLFPPFEVRPSLDAYTTLLCLALAVVPYLAANLLPAWRAAVIEPDRILRS